jgi:hypothetical protein
VPVKLAVCGLLLALSVTVRVAVRVPEATGEKVTLILQLVPAASEVPQLSFSVNSPLGAILMPLIERAVGLLLISLRRCRALLVPIVWTGNVSVTGPSVIPNELESAAVGAAALPIPVPLKLAVCGLLPALSVTISVAMGVPATAGLKVTLIVQLALAARESPQSLV